ALSRWAPSIEPSSRSISWNGSHVAAVAMLHHLHHDVAPGPPGRRARARWPQHGGYNTVLALSTLECQSRAVELGDGPQAGRMGALAVPLPPAIPAISDAIDPAAVCVGRHPRTSLAREVSISGAPAPMSSQPGSTGTRWAEEASASSVRTST